MFKAFLSLIVNIVEGLLRHLHFIGIGPIIESFEELAEVCPPLSVHMSCVEPAVKLRDYFHQAIRYSLGISVELFRSVEVGRLQLVICWPHDSPRAEQAKRLAQEACHVLDYEYAAVVLVSLLGHGQPLAIEGVQGFLIRLT